MRERLKNFIGVKAAVVSGQQEEEHFHRDLELLFILDGEVTVFQAGEAYKLRKDDLFLINTNKKHFIHANQDAIIYRVYFTYHFIAELIQKEFFLFWCNTTIEYNSDYEGLRKILREMLFHYLDFGEEQVIKQYSLQLKLLDYLVRHFTIEMNTTSPQTYKENEYRLEFILNYVDINYMHSISLSEIAEKLYISSSSLSRFFTKKTGESFVDYVKKIRLQYAVEDLLYSDKAITRIAIDNGFSNPSALNKIFRESFGITPTEYKNKRKGKKAEEIVIQSKEVLKSLLTEKSSYAKEYESEVAQKINVSMNISTDFNTWENKIINIGSAAIVCEAQIQEQILYIKEHLDFEYIRVWNLFSKRFMLMEKSPYEEINFDRMDAVLDFFVQNKMKLFLDMGNRIDTAVVNRQSNLYKTVECVSFESSDEWNVMLNKFLSHIVKRYGVEIVENWVFEFTFFLPKRPYYKTEKYSATGVWEAGYESVKKHISNAKVAGPGMMPMTDLKLMEQYIGSFLHSKYQPDIFTSISFPYVEYKEEDEVYKKRMTNPNFLIDQTQLITDILNKFNFKSKFFITEWSNSLANRNYIQDSCSRATFILKNIFAVNERVNAMGVWYGSDLLNVYYDSRKILNGSSGILTKNGICKPSFFAFWFLKKLGKKVIEKGANYIVTTNEFQSFQILCFNHVEFGLNYFLKEEDSYEARELNTLFKDSKSIQIKIILNNLINDKQYLIKQRVVNEKHGSILDKWIELGSEQELGPEDIIYLKQTCVPHMSINKKTVNGNKLQLDVELLPHEMRFIQIFEK